MKMRNWNQIDETLREVNEKLEKLLLIHETTEDLEWRSRLRATIETVKCLKEEMIFTFKIED